MCKFQTIGAVSAAVLLASSFIASTVANAADVNLRVHHFMSPKAPLHSQMLAKWEENVEAASDGRIDIELFPSMSLGGKPGDLFDQAADGAVDIVLTLPGYTSGRFNQSEVFELPFLMQNPIATSKAYWDMVDSDLQNGEFEDVQVLAAWVHGPGVVHTKDPVNKLEDLVGMEMRGPTRLATDLLKELGATPVGMPLPLIPENLSKGVITGTLLPWEVTPSIKLAEMVKNHSELAGDRSLYTSVFVLAMNIDSYDDMPDDLRAILDAETGKGLSQFAAEVMDGADKYGRGKAEGNNIISLGEDEVERWIVASQPVYDRWFARATEKGFDGSAVLSKARELISQNQ